MKSTYRYFHNTCNYLIYFLQYSNKLLNMSIFMSESLDSYFKQTLVFLYNNFTKKSNNPEKNTILQKEYETAISIIKEKTDKNREENINSVHFKNTRFTYFYELMLFFRLIIHTRDFEYGKGERYYTYMMLDTLYKYYPEIAVAGLEIILGLYEPDDVHHKKYNYYTFGCWKDIQYLCDYIQTNNGNNKNHPFIEWCVYITILQLENDLNTILEYENRPDKKIRKNNLGVLSLCAKWIPRENKSKGWLFKKMAILWDYRKCEKSYISENTMSEKTHPKAYTKCYMEFRKIVSKICYYLNIVERKMCGGEWSTAIPRDINTTTLIRNKPAFFNLNSNKNSENEDRILCSKQIRDYINSGNILESKKYNTIMNSTNVNSISVRPERVILETDSCRLRNIPLSFFVKEGLRFLSEENSNKDDEIGLNRLWKKYLDNYFEFSNVIPILDISLELDGIDNELYWTAIGLMCLICEKSTINKRIALVNNNTDNIWVNLSDCTDFTSMLRVLIPYTNKTCFKTNQNSDLLVSKVREIFDSMIYVGMSEDNIEKLNFFIVQNNGKMKMQHKIIRKMFIDPDWSLKIPMPHFLYWNLSDDIIEYDDIESGVDRVSILSGYNPFLLNRMIFLGLPAVKTQNPYDNIYNILLDNRYNMAEQAIVDIMSNYM